ncbi:MAG: hypothetical protein SGILL_004350 [Bacillariaceae sp.]
MTRLPPSPDGPGTSTTRNVPQPQLSLDGATPLRSNSPGPSFLQPRLRSVAKYSSFQPQALACSTEIINTSYKDFESSQDYGGPSSLGAIAGPRGVALFRVSRPHVPLMIFSHATNSSTARNSISSLAFQPTWNKKSNVDKSRRLFGANGEDLSSLYLAAARGSGVLVWDTSGHSANPLLGRLLMDPVQDSVAGSTAVSSIAWKANPSSVSGSEPLLATTSAASLSLWDLRAHTTGFKPSLRFSSSRNNGIHATSSVAAPLVQVACSNMSEECATIDASGVVRIYDIRMTERGRSSSGSPLGTFVAHEAGVGILHLPLEYDEDALDGQSPNAMCSQSAWVTWGLENPTASAVVKVWSAVDTSSSVGLKDSVDGNVSTEDYWYMSDDTTAPSPNVIKTMLPSSSAEYQMIAQCSRTNIACARVCAAPVKNAIVVVGYAGVTGTASDAGWYAELLSIKNEPPLGLNATTEQIPPVDAKKNFGVSKIVGFLGGASNASVDKKPLASMLGNLSLGRLQAAELAFSTNVRCSSRVDDQTAGNEFSAETNIVGDTELVLCCLSDSGVITTSALPEALPTQDLRRTITDKQNGPMSPRKKPRSNIARAALSSSSNVQARIFPDNSEGNSLYDLAGLFGSTAPVGAPDAIDTPMRPANDTRFENRATSPLKSLAADESFRDGPRRTDIGGFMPFDMDVPVQPAYGTVNTRTGSVGGLQMGISEISSSAMVSASVDDAGEAKVRDTTSMMENIETDRIPCPRLCGATFGVGNGRLVVFNNGEVKKMWDWYQKSDMIRLSNVPGGQVDTSSTSDPKMLMSKSSTDGDEKARVSPSFGPHSLKELTDMVATAKEAQWGEVNGTSASPDDAMSVLENFFEDESLDSNSDDSGDEDEDDVDEEDQLDLPGEEIDKQHFGNRQWRSNHRSTMVDGQNQDSSRHRHSFGPSSDMLSPIVRVTRSNPTVLNGQSVDLAKRWKLGNWDQDDDESRRDFQGETPLRRNIAKSSKTSLPHYRDLMSVSPKRGQSFSRTRSDPNLSKSDRRKKSRFDVPMDEPGVHGGHYTVRPKMEENMTFLKKLFTHQREAGTTFPTLLIPPDSPVRKHSSEVRGSRSRAPGVPIEKRALDMGHLGVHTLRLPKEEGESKERDELDEIRQLCLFNAKICKQYGDNQKGGVWEVLSEIVQNQMNTDDKAFSGWGGKGGGALGVDTIARFFEYYEKLGDVQMLATMYCVLSGGHRNKNENRPFLLPKGREAFYDTYILRYAELLYAWGLLNVRAELNKHLQFPPTPYEYECLSGEDERKTTQPGVGVACLCPTCGTEVESNASGYCQRCRDFAFRCSICDIAVRGLFTFCETCHHGGHLNHMVEWFSKSRFCPTGCGCQCTFSPPIPHSAVEMGTTELAAAL